MIEDWSIQAREHQKKIERHRLVQIHREKKRREEFIAEKQRRAELVAENRRAINSNIADGMGQGNGWKIKDTGNGFLLEVGYSAIKDAYLETLSSVTFFAVGL